MADRVFLIESGWITIRTSGLNGGEIIVGLRGPGEIRRASLAIFDRSFAVTYALEAVAVLVGLFGLSSSVGAIVLARRREFGMLRHLGMTRGQVGAMLVASDAYFSNRRHQLAALAARHRIPA